MIIYQMLILPLILEEMLIICRKKTRKGIKLPLITLKIDTEQIMKLLLVNITYFQVEQMEIVAMEGSNYILEMKMVAAQ